jgi:SHS2 domain-containing protein
MTMASSDLSYFRLLVGRLLSFERSHDDGTADALHRRDLLFEMQAALGLVADAHAASRADEEADGDPGRDPLAGPGARAGASRRAASRYWFEPGSRERLHLWSPDLAGLFTAAAEALVVLRLGRRPRTVWASESPGREVYVSAHDTRALLAAWLSQLIDLGEIEHTVHTRVRILHATEHELRAWVAGGYLGRVQHKVRLLETSVLVGRRDRGIDALVPLTAGDDADRAAASP